MPVFSHVHKMTNNSWQCRRIPRFRHRFYIHISIPSLWSVVFHINVSPKIGLCDGILTWSTIRILFPPFDLISLYRCQIGKTNKAQISEWYEFPMRFSHHNFWLFASRIVVKFKCWRVERKETLKRGFLSFHFSRFVGKKEWMINEMIATELQSATLLIIFCGQKFCIVQGFIATKWGIFQIKSSSSRVD